MVQKHSLTKRLSMLRNSKYQAFTIIEMVIVSILTTVVIFMAFLSYKIISNLSESKLSTLNYDIESIAAYSRINTNWLEADFIYNRNKSIVFKKGHSDSLILHFSDSSICFNKAEMKDSLKLSFENINIEYLITKDSRMKLIKKLDLVLVKDSKKHFWSFSKTYKPSSLINNQIPNLKY
jgi:hypothetical protein